MKTVLQISILLFVTILSHFGIAQNEFDDKIESPYFKVLGNGENIALPLISTKVKAEITGVIANVMVTQTYSNEGSSPIEAVYVFPGSTKSAVNGLSMKIGDRTIQAKITEKLQAKKEYEKAQTEGKTASLLEQHRPNVFQMNVANILPGDHIEVTLTYNEILIPEDAVYEFVFPTVVGPRYADSNGVIKDSWITNPFANKPLADKLGLNTDVNFEIEVKVNAPVTIQEAYSPSHEVKVNFTDKKQAVITPSHKHEKSEKDFIVRYRLSGEKIESGFTVYEGDDENYFMLMMQPPQRVLPSEIPPREYIFIIDVSGSMHGFPINTTKGLMRKLLGNLKPQDKFNVLLFSAGSSLYARESVSATKENIVAGINFIDKESGSGGTELLPAMERALSLPGIEGVSRSIVIATDGYVTVEKEAFDLIRNKTADANFFAFGIGSSVNRYIIEGMAHAGNGEPFVVLNTSEADETAEKFRKYIESPVLSKVRIDIEGLQAYDVEPKNVGDLFAEKPILVMGKFKGQAKGKAVIKGIRGNGEYRNSVPLLAKSDATNSSLEQLWARQKIMRLSDYDNIGHGSEVQEEITQLGLKHNLLTKYTSFLAVDDQVRTNPAARETPVSSGDGAVPEPHEWALIIVSLLIATYYLLPYFKNKWNNA